MQCIIWYKQLLLLLLTLAHLRLNRAHHRNHATWLGPEVQMTATLGLALTAFVVYMAHSHESQARRELQRAQCVAKELEKIAEAIRGNLSKHVSSVARFTHSCWSCSLSIAVARNSCTWPAEPMHTAKSADFPGRAK